MTLQDSARSAVAAAIRAGRLVRQPCEVCGDLTTHGHHHRGYAGHHRLDVRWLCPIHHAQEHGTIVRSFRERRIRLGRPAVQLSQETGISRYRLGLIEGGVYASLAEHQAIETALAGWETK